ncbi:methionyl-tRNA formyltransferase [Amycolatopsis viridis]|uniref:Methionyl-tRNA formyltransferase n=1 Tax=Amycolatopsis viridis TaxID=185678 RepID=A0ABX0SV66_9PSEU|nr:methionyl-tRNA formyltransferase [Amycolatopsis viridis]NIH80862.1 methionyl-tRNA formyltransferase [Amycolatopsis viridis]
MSGPQRSSGRVVFVGAVHEALPALSTLLAHPAARVVAVLTPPAEQARQLSGAVDLAAVGGLGGVRLLRADDINAPAVVGTVRRLAPDLLVVVGWTRLLGPELLSVPARGCVGFHASLLPRHRGRAPVNWAILRGETLTGNTMLFLDPGADTGDIIDQRPVRIRADDTCATVYERVAAAGAQMLAEHLPALLAGTAPRRPQSPSEGDLLPRRTPAMGILDWNRPARAVHDWVRALTRPYPGAFSALHGNRTMIWRTRPPGESEPDGPAGTILAVDQAGVRVATSPGSVVVTSMSDPDQPPRHAADWCAEHGIRPGARFAAVPPALARWARGEGPRPEVLAR